MFKVKMKPNVGDHVAVVITRDEETGEVTERLKTTIHAGPNGKVFYAEDDLAFLFPEKFESLDDSKKVKQTQPEEIVLPGMEDKIDTETPEKSKKKPTAEEESEEDDEAEKDEADKELSEDKAARVKMKSAKAAGMEVYFTGKSFFIKNSDGKVVAEKIKSKKEVSTYLNNSPKPKKKKDGE